VLVVPPNLPNPKGNPYDYTTAARGPSDHTADD
jgi:hypothetical protein